MKKRHVHKMIPKASYGELTKLNKFMCVHACGGGDM
jgi:hypothetical protein